MCASAEHCQLTVGLLAAALRDRHVAMQELSLLAGNKLQKHGSEDLSGMAQFSSAMSLAPPAPKEPAWDAKFNTFPMTASLPMPPVRYALHWHCPESLLVSP